MSKIRNNRTCFVIIARNLNVENRLAVAYQNQYNLRYIGSRTLWSWCGHTR